MHYSINFINRVVQQAHCVPTRPKIKQRREHLCYKNNKALVTCNFVHQNHF